MTQARATQKGTPDEFRRALMLYGSTAALAASLMLADGMAGPARAQEIGPRITMSEAAQGSFVVAGPTPAPFFEQRSPTLDIVNVPRDAVLNWSTYDSAPKGGANGNSYVNFLPADTELRFVGNGQNFTAINRIFTTQDNAGAYRGIAFQGRVTSYLSGDGPGVAGPVGGNIWFYSPGGILATGSAAFSVGSLLLSTSDLQGFVERGSSRSVAFTGVADPFSAIVLQPGARVALTQAASSFAIVAPTLDMGGEVQVDGSVLYLSAEQGSLTFFGSGEIGHGVTAEARAGNRLAHSGSTTGPASLARDDFSVFDTQIIEFRSARDVRVLLSGSLGYAPATDASFGPNGAIVLTSGPVETQGNLAITSDLSIDAPRADLRARVGETIAMGGDANGAYALTVLSPEVNFGAEAGGLIAIAGNVVLSSPGTRGVVAAFADAAMGAQAGGILRVGGSLQLDASTGLNESSGQQGGTSSLTIGDGARVVIGGDLEVLARSHAIADAAGVTRAIGGQASVVLNGTGSVLDVAGALTVAADALPWQANCECSPPSGGSAQGGMARLVASGGTLRASSATVSADALAFANGINTPPGGSIDAVGGAVVIDLGVSDVEIAAVAASARAQGAWGDNGHAGGAATGGSASFAKGAGGALAVNTLSLDAGATGGEGSLAQTGQLAAASGGAATGGTVTLALGQNAANLRQMSLRADAQGGRGGSAGQIGGARGGDGGGAVGGTVRIALSGAGTVLDAMAGTPIAVTATGGAGGDGFQGGAGGHGGTGEGGSIGIRASHGAEFVARNALESFGYGGQGGRGGDGGQVAQGPARAPGLGGTGGNGRGGAIELVADGGMISGNLDLDARGFGGSGGARGLNGNGNAMGFAAGGRADGGAIALRAVDTGASRFAIGSAVMTAGGDRAGSIVVEDFSSHPQGGMRFGSLLAQAQGNDSGPVPNVRLSAAHKAIIVDGPAALDADSIALDFTGSGRLLAGGAVLLNAGRGNLAITHSGNPGAASVEAGGAFDAYAADDYVAGNGTSTRSAQTLTIRAARSVVAAETAAAGDIHITASGDATIGNAAAGGSFELHAGRRDFDGGHVFDPASRARVTGAVRASGGVLIQSGGFAEFASGSSVRSDNAIRVRTGDDIILAQGAVLESNMAPNQGSSIHLLAGDINPGGASGGLTGATTTPIASLVLAGAIDTNGHALFLHGDAVDGTGGTIRTGDLTLDVTASPPNAPPNNDAGLLSAGCYHASACLGELTATGDVMIGQASGRGLTSLRTGGIAFTGRNFVATTLDGLDINPAGLAGGTFTATGRIALRSVRGSISLAALTFESPRLEINARHNLDAATADLISANGMLIRVGTSLFARTIRTGRALTDSSDSSAFSLPGDFVVGTLAYTGGDSIAITAGGKITLGTGDAGGADVVLTALGAVSLGATSALANSVRLTGESVDVGSIRASGTVRITSGAGGIRALSLAAPAILTQGAITLASGGEIRAGTIEAGGALGVTAKGVAALARFSAGGDVSLSGSTLDLGSGAVTGRFQALSSSGDLAFESLTVAGDLDLAAAQQLWGGTARADGRAVLQGQSLAMEAIAARRGISLSTPGSASFAALSSSGGAVTLDAGGAVRGGLIDAAGEISVAGAEVTLEAARFGSGLALFARVGDLAASGLYHGAGPARLTAAGTIAIGSIDTQGSLALEAGGAARFADLRSQDSITIAAGGPVTGGTLAAKDAVSIDAGDALTLTGLVANDARLRSSGGAITASGLAITGQLTASGRALALTAPGALRVNATATGGTIAITAGGDLTVNAAGNGEIALASTGASVIIGNAGQAAQGVAGIGAEAVEGRGAVTVNAFDAISVAENLIAGGALTMNAGGLISLEGTARGQTIALRSGDLAIGPNATLGGAGTQRVALSSTNAVTIGSGAAGGFAIDAAEFGRIQSGGDLLLAALAGGSAPGAGSLSTGSLAVNAGSGGQIGSEGTFSLSASGVLRINDTLAVNRAGAVNALTLTGDHVEIDYLRGRLAVLDGAGAATGQITVIGRLITAMSAAAAADIAGQTPQAISLRLGRADATRETGLFSTASLTLDAREAVLIQNSGGDAADARRGLLVGALTLRGGDGASPLMVLNGIVAGAFGNNAAQRVTLATPLAAGSTFNGCILANIASCFVIPEPEVPLVIAPGSILFGIGDLIRSEEDEDSEVEDGVADGKPEAPPIDTTRIDDRAGQPLIDDPVTGAGNEDLWQPPED